MPRPDTLEGASVAQILGVTPSLVSWHAASNEFLNLMSNV